MKARALHIKNRTLQPVGSVGHLWGDGTLTVYFYDWAKKPERWQATWTERDIFLGTPEPQYARARTLAELKAKLLRHRRLFPHAAK